MSWFSKERKLRRVEPGDLGYAAVLAALELPPGPEREHAAARLAAAQAAAADAASSEYYVYDGEDGNPAAVAVLTDRSEPGLLEAWLAVDPVLRNFGIGNKVFDLVCARARKRKAVTLLGYAGHRDGVVFLATHGFDAVPAAELPSGALAGGRLTL